MPRTEPVPPGPSNDLSARVRALEREVDRLRQVVDAHHRAVADEVRTRRLVVTDPDGFERIVAEGADHRGSLAVRARSVGGGSTKVELFAGDALDGDASHIGLALGRDGDVVATIEVSGSRPVLWLDDDEC